MDSSRQTVVARVVDSLITDGYIVLESHREDGPNDDITYADYCKLCETYTMCATAGSEARNSSLIEDGIFINNTGSIYAVGTDTIAHFCAEHMDEYTYATLKELAYT